jgi:cytochrome c-type biogenesis protein CcmE
MNMKKYKKFIIGGVVVVLALAVLGYAAFMGGNTYYYDVGQFLDEGAAVLGKNVRVSGLVAEGSYKQGFDLYFTLEDMTGRNDTLKVVYNGSVPDTFKEGQQIVAEGKLIAGEDTFVASQLVIKCSSKYEPVE